MTWYLGLQKWLLNLVLTCNICGAFCTSPESTCEGFVYYQHFVNNCHVEQKLLSHFTSICCHHFIPLFHSFTAYILRSSGSTIWLSPSRLYKSEQIAWSAHLLSLLALFLLQHRLPKQRNSNTKQLHQNPTLTSPSRGSSDRISTSRLPLALKPFNFSHQQGLILVALRDREASGLFTWAGRGEWAMRMSWGETLVDFFFFFREPKQLKWNQIKASI